MKEHRFSPSARCVSRLASISVCFALCAAAGSAAEPHGPARHHHLDIGTSDDETFIGQGIYQREAPNPKSTNEFYRAQSRRWFGNRWTMQLPVIPRTANLVTLEARFSRSLELTIGDGWTITLEGIGDRGYEYAFILPQEAVGERSTIAVSGVGSPPYVPPADSRDSRELAMAVASVRVQAIDRLDGTPIATRPAAPSLASPKEHFVNLGLEGDERYVVQGVYGREGPWSWSKDPLGRWTSFRWFSNQWTLQLPVFPRQHQEIVIRGRSDQPFRVTLDDQLLTWIFPAAAPEYTMRLFIPADRLGDRETIQLTGTAAPPSAAGSDRRQLVMLGDWVQIRALETIPADYTAIDDPAEHPEADLPLAHRLRGTESRPLFTDVEAYVHQARLMRCNVMTIGPMNGQHWTAFPTERGIPHPNMQPDFLPQQLAALHRWGIAAIGWLPFNVQDLRRAEDCQAAKKYPQWQMQYIDWPDQPAANKVGMCVVASPWRQVHGEILREAATTGIDAVFFDGFYLGGIPHPTSPGCVCRFCQEAFRHDTGLETPPQVDWTDTRFKRWVRWRNDKLLEVAREFRDRMREVNPDLQVTCNWNVWPFGTKDWDTAIPLWAVDDLGTSQHAYTGRPELEWVMLGFKSRLSHDLNPRHADIWRTSRPVWDYRDSPDDRARHELTMRTFMLSGLTYGTTPWHGGHIQPAEIGIRVHEAVRRREHFFSQHELRHLGIVLSQNTHDFYGHLLGTNNRDDYRDTLLGTWLLLTEKHVPFRLVFDNQLQAQELATYRVLLLPNTACLSGAMVAQLAQFVAGGGRLIATADAGWYDQWGERRTENPLAAIEGIVLLDGEPALKWLRTRDGAAAEELLAAVRSVPMALEIEAPKSLAVNASWAPAQHGSHAGALWVHLLNVSAFYTGDDTGFRGLDAEPVYAGDVASDAQIRLGSRILRSNRRARNILIRAPGLSVRRAWLGVAGSELRPRSDGSYTIPEVDVHDVLVLETAPPPSSDAAER